ncbi:MAG: hypothetical protein HEQ15_11210 [Betaproteobacteria bacterium]|jgi:hypothetical protein
MNRKKLFKSIVLVVGAVAMPWRVKANALVAPVGDSLRSAEALRASVPSPKMALVGTTPPSRSVS